MLVEVVAGSGRLDSSLDLLDGAVAKFKKTRYLYFEAEMHRQRGIILLQYASPHRASAETAFNQALVTARAQRTRSFELRAALDLARLYCDTGREREAQDLLSQSLVGFTDTAELPAVGEAHRLSASLAG